MAAATVKTDPIQNDTMKFRTQIIDGKPQIFFDTDENSSKKTRSKRYSRAANNTNRFTEQQKGKNNNQKPVMQNGVNKNGNKNEQTTSQIRVNEDGSTLGVYMTMDELADLVKAVKENSNTDNKSNIDTKPPAAPPPQYLSSQHQHQQQQQQQQQNYSAAAPPAVPKLDLSLEPPPAPAAHISPREQVLSMMADKKRQKWSREKAEIERLQLEIEYDQLKHQLSPRYKPNAVSPERSTFQYDFPAAANKPPPYPQLQKTNGHQNNISPKVNENPNIDALKTQLMEKKQQQWKQENSEKPALWDPFGRPGAGAPNGNETQQRITQPPSNNFESYRPTIPQPQQRSDNGLSSSPPAIIQSNQTHIPAAMRRNLFFGDVRFEDDVKTAKEIERRQWVEDLQRQVEENKNKRNFQQETERHQNFLHQNIQPLLQEAAYRHQQQQQQQQKEPSPPLTMNNNTQEQNNYYQNDTSQVLDKLRRNGYPVDLITKPNADARPNGYPSNQNTGEKIFGPTYDLSSKENTSQKVEPLHLNVNADRQNAYRPMDARRDEAVNTVDTTFRSDHGVQTDTRKFPNRQNTAYNYEDSDLPPQVPNHHFRNLGYRNLQTQPGKRNSRMHSHEDTTALRRASNMNDDGSASQMSNQYTNSGPVDINNRPLWNYKNPQHREYVPNSKRDPHYERRQRLKHFEQGNFDRIDDVQKKTCYNRWNSDSELQQKKPSAKNRVHSTITKPSAYGNQKEESIMNLLKVQNRYQQEALATRKPSSMHTRMDDEYNSNRGSSLDKYDNYVPYTRADEMNDQSKMHTPGPHSRDTSPHKELLETNTNDNYQHQEWDYTNRQNPYVEQVPYSQPLSRQEHILQQLSVIKENLVRRQRELASSTDTIPV